MQPTDHVDVERDGAVSRYDRIGHGYGAQRREDPDVRARIHAALGPARSVVNVGAGTGNYEPLDRTVIAVEPSHVMAAQRPPERPCVRAMAHDLPLHDQHVDAAMAVLSLHHWAPDQRAGVAELCRVARDAVVILTIDPVVCGRMWLLADYLVEVAAMDLQIFPSPTQVAEWMDRPADIQVIPVSRDTPDRTLMAFWAHPEWVLDPAIRASTSGFARQPPHVVERVVADVSRDLADGTWDRLHGGLRHREDLDVGLRLIVARR